MAVKGGDNAVHEDLDHPKHRRPVTRSVDGEARASRSSQSARSTSTPAADVVPDLADRDRPPEHDLGQTRDDAPLGSGPCLRGHLVMVVDQKPGIAVGWDGWGEGAAEDNLLGSQMGEGAPTDAVQEQVLDVEPASLSAGETGDENPALHGVQPQERRPERPDEGC